MNLFMANARGLDITAACCGKCNSFQTISQKLAVTSSCRASHLDSWQVSAHPRLWVAILIQTCGFQSTVVRGRGSGAIALTRGCGWRGCGKSTLLPDPPSWQHEAHDPWRCAPASASAGRSISLALSNPLFPRHRFPWISLRAPIHRSNLPSSSAAATVSIFPTNTSVRKPTPAQATSSLFLCHAVFLWILTRAKRMGPGARTPPTLRRTPGRAG